MENKIFVPDDFYCPITGDLMIDPVSDPEGFTYEKSSIVKWLESNHTSPMTRSPLSVSDLIENKSLKKSIESIREKLKEDQLKIESRISDLELKSFTDSLNDIQLNSYYLNDKLFVNIQTPDVDVRPPIDIVLCIDISGSMGTEATLKGDKNETISHGFSVLSLTISAAKTILNNLNEHDNISIVTYSDTARTIFENMPCSCDNKKNIEKGLDLLRPTYTTNMWSGMVQSLDILRTTSPLNKVKGILLLTDGIPNVEPPRGHEYMLEKYFKDHDFKCMVSAYGFGYNLNSELLLNISNISGGDGYSFIPDASILGNVFIHGISNLFSTAACKLKLRITLSKDVTFLDNSQSLEVEIDSLKYGQDKNLMFEVNTQKCSSRSLDYLNDIARVELSFHKKVLVTDVTPRPGADYYLEQTTRNRLITLMNECIQKKKFNDQSFEDKINAFSNDIGKRCDNSFVKNIHYDLNGQIKEALNMTSQGQREDWFSRWGIHYLRSLGDAYQHEICNNFKDKGISTFGGKLFNQLRDEVSDVFDSQPPPKVDIKVSPQMRGCSSLRHSAPVNMRQYNNSGGGCCAEGCRIRMTDNSLKKVEHLEKGDEVMTFNEGKYNVSRIECVVKTICDDGKEFMVELDNLKITPYHPIIFNGKWSFPINVLSTLPNISEPNVIDCPAMYTFVIENRESVIIEDYVFATYGHYLPGDVISHRYFGTYKVIYDLKNFPSYGNGYVQLTKDMFKKNNEKVCKISL